MYYFTKEGLEKFKLDFETAKHEYYENMKLNNFDKETNLSEGSSFLFRKNELYNRFKQTEKEYNEKINNYIIIEDTDDYINWTGKTIIRKCEVFLNWNGMEQNFKILGDNESDLENDIMSCEAPIAKLLLGHKIGDILDFRNNKIEILDIQPIKEKKLVKTNK